MKSENNRADYFESKKRNAKCKSQKDSFNNLMVMLEQMVETRAWKAARGLIEDGRCRVCQEQVETV